MVEKFLVLVNGAKLVTIVVSILVDFILGVIIAIKEKTFEFQKLAEFLPSNVFYYLSGYFSMGIVALVEPTFEISVPAAFALIEVTLVSSILEKLKKLGLPVPARLTI